MKIFVDFEATQPGNEIIEIGAVAETGEEFHTYVRPLNSEITPFIEKLTGITQETVDNAPSPQLAFDRFRDWVCIKLPGYNYSDIEFIAYGDSDKLFLTKTIKNNLSKLWDNRTLGLACYMAQTIVDYSKTTKRFFNTKISLIKAFNYIKEIENKQRHAALEDAEMLRAVFNSIDDKEPLSENPFIPTGDGTTVKNAGYTFPSGRFFARPRGCAEIEFENIFEAVKWHSKRTGAYYQDRVAVNIMKSIRKNKEYNHVKWRREK